MLRDATAHPVDGPPMGSVPANPNAPPALRSLAVGLLALLVLTATAPMPAGAATGSAPRGTFECFYNGSGQRIVRAHLPGARSSYSLEQVWWYAAVFRKNRAGKFVFVGYTFPNPAGGGDLMTGFATPGGLATGAIVPGAKWTNARTSAIPSHGGQLAVSRGTYRVAGYFWWQYGSPEWVRGWAKNSTGAKTCRFGS